MDYRYIVFLTVVETLSFSKAAKKLFISQPAVTKHIKELENHLNISLFQRKGNKIYLTKAGEIVYKFNKQAVQLYSDMEFSLGELKDEHKGSLRLGASSTIAQYVIPKVLAQYHKKYPKIELSLFNGNSVEIEQLLLDNKIDIALVENSSSRQNLRYLNFLSDEIIGVTAVNGMYGRKGIIDVTDLQQIPLVLREFGSGTLEVIEECLTAKGISINKLNVFLHLGSTETIKHFLIDFEGIALISEKAVENEIRLNILKKISIKGVTIKREFRVVTPFSTVVDVAKNFMNFLFNYNF